MKEYRVDKYDDDKQMQAGLNAAAREGWEPVSYAIHGVSRRGWHYVILTRTVAQPA